MKTPKHVVWFLCDQLRWDYLGFTGNKIANTPNLDQLAKDGVIFENMFVQYPTCMASRASMLTGRYPATIRMSNGSAYLDPREITLPEILQNNNFKTGMFGKLHITPQMYTKEVLKSDYPVTDGSVFLKPANLPELPSNPVKNNYGFNVINGCEDTLKAEYQEWVSEKDPEMAKYVSGWSYLEHNSNCKMPDVGISRIPAELHNSAFIAEKAIEFYQSNKDKNLFMEVSFIDPHHPWDPPAEVASHYPVADMPLPKHTDLGNLPIPQALIDKGIMDMVKDYSEQEAKTVIAYYHAMIELVDHSIGRVINAIKKAGDFDNTLFVFCSDHGEHLGSNGLYRKGCLHYDHLIKSPCFMTWKNGFKGGQTHTPLLQAIDIAPTILSLLNIAAHPGMQGKDYTPALKGEQTFGRNWIYSQEHWCKNGLYIDALTVRTNKVKLNYYPADRIIHLFDLEEDPDERQDLSGSSQHQDLLKSMLQLLVESQYAQKDPLPTFLSQF